MIGHRDNLESRNAAKSAFLAVLRNSGVDYVSMRVRR